MYRYAAQLAKGVRDSNGATSRQNREQQRIRELEVPRSGYYGWLNRKPSERRQRNQALKTAAGGAA